MIPLKAHEIKQDFIYLEPGYFDIILEVSLTEMRFQVISGTEIWRNYVHPVEEWTGWRDRLKTTLSAFATPLASDLLQTFGKIVHNERIALTTADIEEQFSAEIKRFFAAMESKYKRLNKCLPIGPLFELPNMHAIVTAHIPGTGVLPARPDRTLPQDKNLLQRELYQTQDFKPRLMRDYFYGAIDIDEERGVLKPKRLYLAGPSYIDKAENQNTRREDRTEPRAYQQKLWVEPSTSHFYLSIDTADIDGKRQALFKGHYERIASDRDVVLHLVFHPGRDEPTIHLDNAKNLEDVDISSSIHPNNTIDEMPPPKRVSVAPQLMFLLDGRLINLDYMLDSIVKHIVTEMRNINNEITYQIMLFDDYDWANGQYTVRPSHGWQWRNAEGFLVHISPEDRVKNGYVVSGRAEMYRGALEAALKKINDEIEWEDGERFLIAFGMGGPHEPDEYSPMGRSPIDWRAEVARLREKKIHALSFFINQAGTESANKLVEAAGVAWEALGYSMHRDDLLFSQNDADEAEYALNLVLGDVLPNARPRERYLFERVIPWPLYKPYWQFADRTFDDKPERPPEYDEDFDGIE